MKSTVIPDDKTEITALDTQNEKVQEQVRILLEEAPVANEPKPFTLVRNLYASCMNKCMPEIRMNTMNISFIIPKT